MAKKKLALKTLEQRAAAIRFFFIKLLRQHYLPENIPFPKLPRRLPTVLSQEEVQRMLECKMNLMHRAMLLTLYSTGLRRAELTHLQVEDIDRKRMMIRVRKGKGSHERDVPLSSKLLEVLREYWRWQKPTTYLEFNSVFLDNDALRSCRWVSRSEAIGARCY